jgi:hypothetical protein
MKGKRQPVVERFWEKVNRDGPISRLELGPCWVWTNATNGHYGKIGVEGRPVSVHRVSWELHYGPVPEGLLVLHHCDEQLCVKPDHLFLGTHRDNTQDMVQKGRDRFPPPFPRGEAHYAARLTRAQVIEIRSRYPAETQLQLAQVFGVGRSTIGGIVRGDNWVDV